MALNRNEVGLQFSISVDLGNSVRQLQSFQDQIRQTASRIQSDMAAASATIRQTTQQTTTTVRSSLANMGDAFASVGGTLTASLTAPLVALGAAAVKSATDFDRAKNQITALTGSVDEANKVIERLRVLVQTTPGLTASLAQDAFGIFQSLGKIGQESIFNITSAIGQLNAAVNLPDATAFARNLTQIFSQGFERGDIKEALGQVPFFEELLKEAFGVNAERLGELQKAGQLTADEFVNGLARAIRKRFPNVTESISVEFQKTFGELMTSLRPLGEQIVNVLLPMFKTAVGIVKTLMEAFNNLSPGMKEFIVQVGLVAAALGPAALLIGKVMGLISSLGSIIGAIGGLGLLGKLSALASTVATFSMAHPVIAGVVVGVGALITLFTNWDTVVSVVQKNLKQIFANPWDWLISKMEKFDLMIRNLLRKIGVEVADAEYKVLGKKPGYEMEGTAAGAPSPTTPAGETEQAKADRETAELKKELERRLRALGNTGGEGVKGVQDQIRKLMANLQEEQIKQSMRLLDAETAQRLVALKDRYDKEEITLRQFNAEKFRLQIEQANRELAAIKTEGVTLTKERGATKDRREQITIDREILKVRTDQKLKEMEIAQLYKDQQQSLIAQLPFLKANVQEMIGKALPSMIAGSMDAQRDLVEGARKRLAEQIGRLNAEATRTQTQIINVENQLQAGTINREEAQKRINELLQIERTQRLDSLLLQQQQVDLSEEAKASLQQQVVTLQSQVEGFKDMTVGDALENVFDSIRQPAEMVQDALMGIKSAGQQALEVMILTGQFSGQAFMKAAKQAIAAMTAEAAVAAIMQIAKGFAALAIGDVKGAASAFKAAAAFKLVGTIAGGAAASLALNAIAPGGASESGGTGGRFVTGGAGRPETISLIQGQQGNRREPQVVIIRAETEPGVIIRKVADSYRDNGEMRQLIRQDLLQGTI